MTAGIPETTVLMGEDLEETELGFYAGGSRSNLHLFWLRVRSWNRARILGASLLVAGVAFAAIGSKVVLPSDSHQADKSERMAGATEVLEAAASNASVASQVPSRELVHPASAKNVADPGLGWPKTVFRPRLLCFSVMNRDNPKEIAIVKMQVRYRIGIAACERFIVLSGERMYLGKGHKLDNGTVVDVFSWFNPAMPALMGNLQAGDETDSFKNTQIFIDAWSELIKSGALERTDYDWAVKIDPDAVFFPERLRTHLKKFSSGNQTKTPTFFKNCNWGTQARLYGALEVFNAAAMKELTKKMHTCNPFPWGGWGEDLFMERCMEKLGVHAKTDFTMVGDHRCMDAPCEDITRVSFHAFKSEQLWLTCWSRSRESEKNQKVAKQGQFFCCGAASNQQDPCNSCNLHESGFCAFSKRQCHECDANAIWCKRGDHSKRNVLA